MNKALPSIVLGLLVLATVAFFGPQHRDQSTQGRISAAPDSKPQTYSNTTVCGGLQRLDKQLYPDVLILFVLGMLLALQILALRLDSRRLRIATGISTLVGAVIANTFASGHNLFNHALFTKSEMLWGQILLIATLLIMVPLGIMQICYASAE